MLLANFNSITDVIAMSMSTQQDVGLLYILFVCGTYRIPHDPWIDIQRIPLRSLDAKSRMSKPSEFDAIQNHKEKSQVLGVRSQADLRVLLVTLTSRPPAT